MVSATSPGTCTRGFATHSRPPARPSEKPASALVRACTPTRPPAATSCSSPAEKPATQPASGPRRSAQKTVRMNGRSGVAPPTESTWTRLDCATLPPRVRRSSHFTLALPREEPGQVLRGLAGQQEHFLDPREVDHRRQYREVEERRAFVLDGDDPAHRQALGEHVPLPGGHEDVAHDDTRPVARHVLETPGAARVALDEAGRPGPLHHCAYRRRGVVQELHHRGARPHAYDPAHQAVGDDDRRLRRDARPRAAIDGERAPPAAALAPDHLAGQRGHGQALTEAEEPAQPIVLLASLDDLQRLT